MPALAGPSARYQPPRGWRRSALRGHLPTRRQMADNIRQMLRQQAARLLRVHAEFRGEVGQHRLPQNLLDRARLNRLILPITDPGSGMLGKATLLELLYQITDAIDPVLLQRRHHRPSQLRRRAAAAFATQKPAREIGQTIEESHPNIPHSMLAAED